ncbi:RNA-binding protein 45 [Bienertia sinuspersici]
MAGKETSKESSAIDTTGPLHLYPSEGSLVISKKLQGIANYRYWKRTMEIALAARKKLGFVTWAIDTCNNVVISWLHASVSDTIKKSVLYNNSTRDIWLQLQRRFILSNGALKYRISKALECVLWEELENLNDYPVITQMNPDVRHILMLSRNNKKNNTCFNS